MGPLVSAFAATVVFALAPGGAAGAATLLTQDKAAEIASPRNGATKDGEVSGEIVNNSKNPIRDVELQILYSWRWKDEFHPGEDDPGRAVYHVIDREVPPGQSVRFTYKPSPPLPSRKDGHFEISVSVAGFTEVFH